MLAEADTSVLAARGLAVFEDMAGVVVVPRVRACLLREWDAAADPESAVVLLENLAGLAADATADLLRTVVFPKLQRAVEEWDARGAAARSWDRPSRMDLWLLPWLPHLRAELEPLFPTIRRKVLAALGACELGEASGRQQDFLRPWMRVLGPRAADAMAVHVGGCLAAQVRLNVSVNPADQRLDALDAAVAWSSVLPPPHVSCLLRGELFPNWHAVLVSWVARTDAAANAQLVAWYQGWKSYVASKGCLEDGLRAEFGHALAVMRAGRQLPAAEFARAWTPAGGLSYARCLRQHAALAQAAGAAPANDPKKSQPRPSAPESFKTVVAAFAESRGVEFSMKAARNSDGKSLYDFGGKTVLIEQDMVYLSLSGVWRPVALEDLCR